MKKDFFVNIYSKIKNKIIEKQYSKRTIAIASGICAVVIIGAILFTSQSFRLKIADVGDYVTFGEFEQDNNESNGKEPIKWKVLDKKDGKLLLISEKILDNMAYDDNNPHGLHYIHWEKCALRKWLNKDFINIAFSEGEKKKIVLTLIGRDEGKTEDKVFLLSAGEARKYFNSNKERIAYCTKYASLDENNSKIADNWWLIDTGKYYYSDIREQYCAAAVDDEGSIRCNFREGKCYGPGADFGIRPVMWVIP